MPVPRIATYRLQLTPTVGFSAAAGIVGELAELGISHVYLSPVAEAVPGSTHGYDVVRPDVVRAQLGGENGLRRLAEVVADHGMGLLVDIVPNHVATAGGERNPWWWALLRDGPTAEVADHFDVDWDNGGRKVLIPVLADPLDEVLAAGDLVLDGDTIRYHDHRFPVRAGTSGTDVARVLDAQHYRLLHWRDDDRNMRRFFAIDDLVAIRPEVDAVADAVHRIAAELDDDDLLDGVRIDHIDGLADPTGYLDSLRAMLGEDAWILVEKILVGDERLPSRWPVDGTTGYEWITVVDHLFTHDAGESPFTDRWHAVSGDARSYHELERESIRHVLTAELRPDLERVARVAASVVEADQAGRRPTVDELVQPLIELTVALGRYRTYLRAERGAAPSAAADAAVVTRAAAAAERLDDRRRELLDRLVAAILAGSELAVRWQQLSGPALAKGGEDRALYRYLRLSAHNEVGGDPDRWSLSLDEFHHHNATMLTRCPTTLLAGTTHDTKRSEDVRARLLALTERPRRWTDFVDHCLAVLTADASVDPTRDPVSTYLALQTAVGTWPIDRTRLGEYLVKAAREADVATSWTDPDAVHESMLTDLAAALVEGRAAQAIAAMVAEIDDGANAISAAQLVLRCTAPGVPDLYQGSETWLRVLVDPDNRRPLDPTALRDRIERATAADSVWSAPEPKTALAMRLLHTRRAHHECFGPASGYGPLSATGRHADHVIAFARTAPSGDRVLTVAGRFGASRPQGWADTSIAVPAGRWTDELGGGPPRDGGNRRLTELLGDDPAAVLTRSGRG